MKVILSLFVGVLFSVSVGAADYSKADAATKKALIAKGAPIFKVQCASCHGEKGEGNGMAAAALPVKPRNFTKDAFKQGSTPKDVFNSITHGVKPTEGPQFMVAFEKVIPEDDRWALAYYVLSLKKK